MIIIASRLITMQPGRVPIENGAIAVRYGKILAVGPASSVIRKFSSHKILVLKNAILMPGLINLHTHLELPPLLARIRAGKFSEWILNLVAVKKGLHLKDYRNASRANIRTLVETGTTTVGEICTHGVSTTRLRKRTAGSSFREIIQLESGKGHGARRLIKPRPDSPSVKYGFSPHTPYTVSESMLHVIARLAKKSNKRLAMHIAESKDEIKTAAA